MSFRIPGPVCQIMNRYDIDDGTTARMPAPKPGTVTGGSLVSLHWPVPAKSDAFAAATVFLEKEEQVPLHPYWPKGDASGVTWGLGWDAGGRDEKEIRNTWAALPKKDLDRLAGAHGKRGADAHTEASNLKDITIPKEVSMAVFKNDSLPAYYAATLKAFPGTNTLPVNTQVALLSLVFNRGGALGKDQKDKKGHEIMDRRWEMRRIREAVASGDLAEIASQLRLMKRVWKGKDIEKGMTHRRNNEAALVDTDVGRYLYDTIRPFVPQNYA